MDRARFDYHLPRELIAQVPLPERSASRLLVLDGGSGRIDDRRFAELPELLDPGDLLVLNDTRVIRARIVGHKPSGGRVEILLERFETAREATVQLKSSRQPALGSFIELPAGARVRILGRAGDLFRVEFDRDAMSYLEAHGEVPLPPYIRRRADAADAERYQTIFGRRPGAVAAPTAGLHFDPAVLAQLEARGIERGFVTLHVGAGTFAPVRAQRIEDHEIHAERVEVGRALCEQVHATRLRGRRVVAVGTTVVRALETAAMRGAIETFSGDTRLFIYPGFEFRMVDAMVTNFHLPESSLLMLVSAFAGHGAVMRAYAHAVAERYRFFSYGDAMLVLPSPQTRAVSNDAV
jgi:S-adenosylmethionine:tRNA ribosyltransferase-isomerase